MRGAPADFSELRVAPGSRTPGEILAHIGDLLDWALVMVKDKHAWRESAPQVWDQDVERFFTALAALDSYIASGEPLKADLDKLFQAPIADALTHVGQIAMLRRIAESPVKPENFFKADIAIGHLAPAEPLKD
jgi:hypothetical protein